MEGCVCHSTYVDVREQLGRVGFTHFTMINLALRDQTQVANTVGQNFYLLRHLISQVYSLMAMMEHMRFSTRECDYNDGKIKRSDSNYMWTVLS